MPYEFLKYKVFGFKRNYEFNATPSLFENENFNLTLEYIEQPNDEHKIANDFLYKVVDYGDETAIFVVKNHGKKTELDGEYLTPFKHKLKESILLQRIRANESSEPTSDLIKFNTINGKIEFIAEIGQFELDKFDEEKNEIVGYNLTEDIVIKMEKACA
ncbi:hypothetical protein ULMA_28370 [Patiriisocius marinus]|uniref:Uncharacterized protein n=2 Tax=Patiriisocius marinus TaxID=1397112 RepID=A0A5J4IS31_9FLAO|nr:hypothetical protein ULMA_28370 [Patiriisocius marinus]